MFISTKAIYQLIGNDYVLVSREGYEYDGPLDVCKGDSVAQQAEASQASFDSDLQGIFTQQFASQQNTLNLLKNTLTPQLTNPTGYSATQLATQRTGASDVVAAQYQDAQKQMQNNQAVRAGSAGLPSGVNAQINASLASQAAQTEAGAQNQITQQNANLQQQNYWNAVNGLNGIAAQENPLGYAGAATSGSGAVSNLSNAVTASMGPSAGSILGGVVGAAGTALGGGSLGTLVKSCWVAAAAFNEDFYTGTKTNLVRNYLWNVWSKNFYAKPVLWMYSKFGKWVSTKPLLVNMLKPLFSRALRNAQEL